MCERSLLEYLPPVIQQVTEYKGILNDAQQPEVDKAWKGLQDGLNDQFISTATENGVGRWEKILGIVPKGTENLKDRKFAILTRIHEQLPFTLTMLEEQLHNLCGANNYALHLVHEKFEIHVQVGLAAKNNYNDVGGLLQRVVPANMAVFLSLKYNQQQALAKFTHKELAKYAHHQLRNEVLTQ